MSTAAPLPADAAALPDPVPVVNLPGPRFRGVAAAVVSAMRTGLKVAGAVAPDATAGWCHRRYFTPGRPPLRPRDQALLAEASPMRLPWKSPKGAPYPVEGELHGFRWGQGPTIVLVHGWDSRAARVAAPLVAPLTAAGFSVVAFDMPGHGDSPGVHSDLLSFIAAIRQICDAVEPHAVLAHSMGAASAIGALAEGAKTGRFVGVGPAVWLTPFPERFCSILDVRGRLRERLFQRLYETFPESEWQDRAAHNLAPKLEIPALLLHSRDDDDTPWSGSVALARRWPSARLVLTDRLGHYKILGDADIQAQIVAFLKEG